MHQSTPFYLTEPAFSGNELTRSIYYQNSEDIDVNKHIVWCLENEEIDFNGRMCFRTHNLVLLNSFFSHRTCLLFKSYFIVQMVWLSGVEGSEPHLLRCPPPFHLLLSPSSVWHQGTITKLQTPRTRLVRNGKLDIGREMTLQICGDRTD